MTHNAEPEAVDLLLEVERLDLLEALCDDKNYGRTCLYLVSCCSYLPEPDDTAVRRVCGPFGGGCGFGSVGVGFDDAI